MENYGYFTGPLRGLQITGYYGLQLWVFSDMITVDSKTDYGWLQKNLCFFFGIMGKKTLSVTGLLRVSTGDYGLRVIMGRKPTYDV